MMDIFLLYLFTRLDQVSFTIGVFFWTPLAVLLGALLCRAISEDAEIGKALMRPIIWCMGIALAVNLVVPTQKQASLILAGSAVLDVAKSEAAGRIASKSVQLIEQTLDGYLAERKAAGK